MIRFNSIEFALFFSVVYVVYLLSPHRTQNRWLLLASYAFYGSWDWRFLSLICTSTIVDYYCGIRIHAATERKTRLLFLWVSIAVNLGFLGFFKYANFFAASLQGLLSTMGWHVDQVTLNIVLPVGISFYTFQTMSYTIDVYRGALKPCRNIFDFALFVSFFPQLVAGPIERAKNLLPQVTTPRKITQDNLYEGSWLVLWGLYKKIFIADNLARIANAVFAPDASPSGAEALLGVYAFAFQIYGDFSGYSDIARGISKLLGFELMNNFQMPYFAANPRDFWSRWHISLSTWLRDYLYIPLGGNRMGQWKTYRNLWITMLLGGLWHGAAWTFIAWGAFHGSWLAVHRLAASRIQRFRTERRHLPRLWWFVCVFATFQLTCLGWLLFRAQSMSQVTGILRSIVQDFTLTPLSFQYATELLLCTGILFVIQTLKELRSDMTAPLQLPAWARGGLYFILLTSMVLAGVRGGQEFIYFQF